MQVFECQEETEQSLLKKTDYYKLSFREPMSSWSVLPKESKSLISISYLSGVFPTGRFYIQKKNPGSLF